MFRMLTFKIANEMNLNNADGWRSSTVQPTAQEESASSVDWTVISQSVRSMKNSLSPCISLARNFADLTKACSSCTVHNY